MRDPLIRLLACALAASVLAAGCGDEEQVATDSSQPEPATARFNTGNTR